MVVGDAEGVVVIPAKIADEVAAEAVEMTAFEDFVSEAVMQGRSILGLYPPTDEQSRSDYAAWRAAKGRRLVVTTTTTKPQASRLLCVRRLGLWDRTGGAPVAAPQAPHGCVAGRTA